MDSGTESPEYLSEQLITYIGNKRALLPFIGSALNSVRERLGGRSLDILDAFSGSGIVSRYFKSCARSLAVNDLERYAEIISRCYLANPSALDLPFLRETWSWLKAQLEEPLLRPGLIAELYAPADDYAIKPGERAFYTRRNACYLDTARSLLDSLSDDTRHFFLAPLLAEASVHANTSGVFKGFHKNRLTGIGQFGGTGRDALSRITGPVALPFPLFSRFECPVSVHRRDALDLARELSADGTEFDLAYLDPPYNQHPYGSNYFMLNLLVDYKRPQSISPVSGIPADWQRSYWNRRSAVSSALSELVDELPARFVLVSFNSEGFLTLGDITGLLKQRGRLTVLEQDYAVFRGSRNLSARSTTVREYLFLLEKH